MGIFEVLPRLPRILRRMRQTARAVEAARPAAVVSIDAPAFCFGVWRRLRRNAAPLIHVVAPTVWAWRPGRAGKYARTIDHLLALLPFEPPYFERVGLPCTFIGHPVLESGAVDADGAAFRARHGLDVDARVVCVLPGSRHGEVARLLEPFAAAVERLARRFPELVAVVPAAPGVVEPVTASCENWPVRTIVATGEADRFAAMAASDVALAASGTVALELALTGVPSVIGYRFNPMTFWIVHRMVRVRYVNLINLLLDRLAVPELLQAACTPANLADEALRLLLDPAAREAQLAAARQAMAMLRDGTASPSERAAETILDIIGAAAETPRIARRAS